MEEREPNQLAQGLAAITDPPAPSHGGDAPATLFFSSSDEDGESDEDQGGEFEFPFVSRDSPAGTAAPADELFADGRIRPTFCYPVFGFGHGAAFLGGTTPAQPAAHPAPRVRGQLGRLFLEESRARNASTSSTASTESTSSSDGGGGAGLELELEGAPPPESYCLWTPGGGSSSSSSSPRLPPRKSSSTGSMARWRRISELVVGRSHSDGKDKLMFFPAPQHKPKPSNSKPKEPPVVSTTTSKQHDKPRPAIRKQQEVDTVHRVAYGTPRRTFLPYREELVGFFANVNGISRSHQHPF